MKLLRRLACAVLGRPVPLTTVPEHVPYFGAKQTIEEAKAKGVSIETLIEEQWGVRGAVEATIQEMQARAALPQSGTIIEIGPGTGNYLRRVKERTSAPLEIYETAPDWRDFLVKSEGVVARESDGLTLRASAGESAALLHAHGVFTTVPALVSYSYFREMMRVCAPKGSIVFDVYPIERFEPDTWLASPHRYAMFLSLTQIETFFQARGFVLEEQWRKEWRPAGTTYLLFRRTSP